MEKITKVFQAFKKRCDFFFNTIFSIQILSGKIPISVHDSGCECNTYMSDITCVPSPGWPDRNVAESIPLHRGVTDFFGVINFFLAQTPSLPPGDGMGSARSGSK